MPTVVEQAKIKASQSTVEGIETATAIELKRFWPILVNLAEKKGIELPTDPTADIKGNTPEETEALKEKRWLEIARGAIDDTRHIKVETKAGTFRLTLDEAEEVIQAQQLGVSLKKRIPTRKQVGLLSETIGTSVQRNTGTGIGFLDDMFGGASLGNMFMGFISWLFSGFQGGFDGLKKNIADLTGNDMAADSKQSLLKLREKHRNTPDDMSDILTNPAIDDLAKQIQRAPLDELNLPAHPKTPAPRIRDIQMGDIDNSLRQLGAAKIKTTLEESLETGFKKSFPELYSKEELQKDKDKTIWDTVSSTYEKARAGIGLPSERTSQRAILDSAKKELSEKLNAILTNKDYRYEGKDYRYEGKALTELSKDDLGKVVAKESATIILDMRKKAVKENGLKEGTPDYNFYAVLAEGVPKELQAEMGKQYDMMRVMLGGDLTKKVKDIIKVDILLSDPQLKKEAEQYIANKIKTQLGMQLSVDADQGRKLVIVTEFPLNEKHFGAIANLLAEPAYKAGTTDKKKYADYVAAYKKNPADVEAAKKATAAYQEVSALLYKELKETKIQPENKTITELALADGVKLNDDALKMLADNMAIGYFEDVQKVRTVPAAFIESTKGAEHRLADIALDKTLDKVLADPKTLEKLREGTKQNVTWTKTLEENLPKELKASLKPELLSFITNPKKAAEIKKPTAYEKVSDDLFIAIKSNPELWKNYTDANLMVLADTMALQYVKEQRNLPQAQKIATATAAGGVAVVVEALPASFIQRRDNNLDLAAIELLSSEMDKPKYNPIIEAAEKLSRSKGATKKLSEEKAAIIKTAASKLRKITQDETFETRFTTADEKYKHVCEELQKELKEKHKDSLADDNVTLMLADLLASKFAGKANPKHDDQKKAILDEMGKSVPTEISPAVKDKLGVPKALATVTTDTFEMGTKAELTEAKEILVQANDNTDINIDAITDAAKPILTPYLTDPGKLAKMTPGEYIQLVDKLSIALQDPKTGIKAENAELRDLLALQLTGGSLIKATPPVYPSHAAKQMEAAALMRICKKIADENVTKSLRPRLTGEASQYDPEGTSNTIIANCLAMEAASENKSINVDAVCATVTEVMAMQLYEKAKTKSSKYKDTYYNIIYDALEKPALGLGTQAIPSLAHAFSTELAEKMKSPDINEDLKRSEAHRRGETYTPPVKPAPVKLTEEEKAAKYKAEAEAVLEKLLHTVLWEAGKELKKKSVRKLTGDVSKDDVEPFSDDMVKVGTEGLRKGLDAMLRSKDSYGEGKPLSSSTLTTLQRGEAARTHVYREAKKAAEANERWDTENFFASWKEKLSTEVSNGIRDKVGAAWKPVPVATPSTKPGWVETNKDVLTKPWAETRKALMDQEQLADSQRPAIKRAEEYYLAIYPDLKHSHASPIVSGVSKANEPNPTWYLTESVTARMQAKGKELNTALTPLDHKLAQLKDDMKTLKIDENKTNADEFVKESKDAMDKATLALETAEKQLTAATPANREELQWQQALAYYKKLDCEATYIDRFCHKAELAVDVAKKQKAAAVAFADPEAKEAFARQLRLRLDYLNTLSTTELTAELSETNPKSLAELQTLEYTKKGLTKRVTIEPAPAEKNYEILPLTERNIIERNPKDTSKALKYDIAKDWPVAAIRELKKGLLKIPVEHRQRAFDENFGPDLLRRAQQLGLKTDAEFLVATLTEKQTRIVADPRLPEGPIFASNLREKAELAGIDLTEYKTFATLPEMKGYQPSATVLAQKVSVKTAPARIAPQNPTEKTLSYLKSLDAMYASDESRIQMEDGQWEMKRSDKPEPLHMIPANSYHWMNDNGLELNKGVPSIVEAAELIRDKLSTMDKASKKYAAYKSTFESLRTDVEKNAKEWGIKPDLIPPLNADTTLVAATDKKVGDFKLELPWLLGQGTTIQFPPPALPSNQPAKGK